MLYNMTYDEFIILFHEGREFEFSFRDCEYFVGFTHNNDYLIREGHGIVFHAKDRKEFLRDCRVDGLSLKEMYPEMKVTMIY